MLGMSLAQNTPDFDGAHQVEELSHSMSWRSGQNYELCLRNDGIHLPGEHPIHDVRLHYSPCPRLVGACIFAGYLAVLAIINYVMSKSIKYQEFILSCSPRSAPLRSATSPRLK
jgi:hypothetical protein